jgi:hypothetical protein
MTCAICDGTYGEEIAKICREAEGGCGWCRADIAEQKLAAVRVLGADHDWMEDYRVAFNAMLKASAEAARLRDILCAIHEVTLGDLVSDEMAKNVSVNGVIAMRTESKQLREALETIASCECPRLMGGGADCRESHADNKCIVCIARDAVGEK